MKPFLFFQSLKQQNIICLDKREVGRKLVVYFGKYLCRRMSFLNPGYQKRVNKVVPCLVDGRACEFLCGTRSQAADHISSSSLGKAAPRRRRGIYAGNHPHFQINSIGLPSRLCLHPQCVAIRAQTWEVLAVG